MKKSKKIETPWKNVPDNIDSLTGFIYLITNLKTGKKYIGKKFFWHKRRVPVKGRKNRKIVIKESDWRYYKSSSDRVKKDIEYFGIDNFKFEILKTCTSKKSLTFEETKYQFDYNVLSSKLNENEDYEFYNDNILGKFFRKDIVDR